MSSNRLSTGALVMALILAGAPAAGALGTQAAWQVPTSATYVAAAKVKATVSGSYATQASGKVLVTVTGTARKAKIRFRTAAGRTKTKTVKLRSGQVSVLLPTGSTPTAVKGLAGGGLAASSWVVLASATSMGTGSGSDSGRVPAANPATSPGATGSGGGSPTDFSFLATQQGDPITPVMWSRCSQISVVVDLGEPAVAELDAVNQAVTSVAAATGLPMVVTGTTDQRSGLPAGANIIFRFTAAAVDSAGSSGEGGFTPVLAPRAGDGATWSFIDSGFVTITTDGLLRLPPTQRLELYMHELGHVSGLDHAANTDQVMYPVDDNSGETPTWGAGDLAGLHLLGTGPCRA